jgi:oligopeptide/dipeptide ABC transporter ATP-binding protein
MSDAQQPALLIDDLEFSLESDGARLRLLSDVSLRLEAGRTLGLVGESGSGKSITCLAIMGLLANADGRIDGGSIKFFGRELAGISDTELRKIRGAEISMIFQEPMTSLDPAYTVGQQIAEIVRTHRKVSRRAARDRAVEMLNIVGIPEAKTRCDDYPHQFSGGMRQRVLIAMALCCEPKVLLADEPTTALDVTTQAQILDLLQDLSQRFRMATMFATHDLGVVARCCDAVTVMYGGEVVEHGTVDQIFYSPTHPYTDRLLACIPKRGGSLFEPIHGHPPSPGSWPNGCRFHPRCSFCEEKTCTDRSLQLVSTGSGQLSRCARQGEIQLRGADA